MMTAHYTPYKNEPDTEQLQWAGDTDAAEAVGRLYAAAGPGRVVAPTRTVAAGALLLVLVSAGVGLLAGFLARPAAHSCAANAVKAESDTRRIQEEISADSVREFLRNFSKHPHMAGTDMDLEQALEIQALWRTQGLDRVDIKPYTVLLSYPDPDRPNSVVVLNDRGGVEFCSRAWESESSDFGPAFNAYSPAGSPQGDLVYANYGQPLEFALLTDKLRVNLTGKIIVMRLGMMVIGEQVRLAEQHGAAGVILYADPRDFRAPEGGSSVYPRSGGLPSYGVQRGTAARPPIGDPLTPGYASTDYAYRIPVDDAESLPRIPVHTLCSSDAEKLLSLLKGPSAPNPWQGALNITYNIGPGFIKPNMTVRIEINNSNKLTSTYNVIGYIRGRTEPDRYVLVGNHRDAWVFGALDPTGGTAVLLELSRVLGQWLRRGWRPRRTLIFCSWGAKEYNMIGSTEWIEEMLPVLQSRAVAYVNLDVAVTGNFSLGAAASPLLYRVLINATQKVSNPSRAEAVRGRPSVYDTWLHAFPVFHNASSLFHQALSLRRDYKAAVQRALRSPHLAEVMQRQRPRIRQLRTGSDCVPFFVRAGIPSVDLSYVHPMAGVYPLYHTAYDTFHLVQSFVDPEFKFHVALAGVVGEMLLDLAESLFLPFNLLDYAQVLRDLTQTLLLNLEVNPQFRKDLIEHNIQLRYLDSAVLNFTNRAIDFHIRQERADTYDALAVRRLNDQLLLLERAFLHAEGLPGRPLDRHLVLSPSRGHTFGEETFPGITDMLTGMVPSRSRAEHWAEFRRHYTILLQTIQGATESLAQVV